MSELLQIQELLNGYTIDKNNVQSVGNMTVLPLVSDEEFTNVADINEVVLQRDVSYDNLEFHNASGKIGIALQGWSIIDDQRAQDRTVPYAHLIKEANSKVIPANCIQHSQCGNFDVSNWDQDRFMVMPPSIRGVALKKASYNNSETGALWSTLKSWVKGIDCDNNGLKYFYSQHEDKLDQFVAQFEPVKNQLGSIVLINDEVIAIDIMPKFDSWKGVWETFIRDSYGGEAIRSIENSGAVVSHPMFKTEDIEDLDDLESAYEKSKSDFHDHLKAKVNSVIQLSVGRKKLEEINELTMVKLENEHYIGQGVYHGDEHIVYLSLVSTSSKPKTKTKIKSLRNNPYRNQNFEF